jgi:hypothetical protein
LYYKYYPSPLAPVTLIEQQEQSQSEESREKEERVEMQLLKKNENMHGYGEFIPFY